MNINLIKQYAKYIEEKQHRSSFNSIYDDKFIFREFKFIKSAISFYAKQDYFHSHHYSRYVEFNFSQNSFIIYGESYQREDPRIFLIGLDDKTVSDFLISEIKQILIQEIKEGDNLRRLPYFETRASCALKQLFPE